MKSKLILSLKRTTCVAVYGVCACGAHAQQIPDPNDPVVLPTDEEVAQHVANVRASMVKMLERDPDGWDDLEVMLWKSYDKNYKFEPGNKTKDTDGDGMSDYEEMLVHRNPTYKEPIYTKEQLIEQVRESRRQSIAAQRKGLADLMPQITAGLQRAAQGRPLPARVTEIAERESDEKAEKERKLDLAEAFMARSEERQKKALRGITKEVRNVLENTDSPLMVTGIGSNGGLELIGPDNVTAAASIQTNTLWPGGTSTLPDVTGYSPIAANWRQMGIWEAGGGVLTRHEAFQFTPPSPAAQVSMSRVVQVDNPATESYGLFHNRLSAFDAHGTNVAGVMAASGAALPGARGMSYEGRLAAYSAGNDIAEMMAAAATGMTVSNHSYSERYGWLFSNGWFWMGRATVGEDPNFGLYRTQSREIDLVANENEYYLSCWSSGNEGGTNDSGPVNQTTGQMPASISYRRIHDDNNDGILEISALLTDQHPSDGGAPLPGAVVGSGDSGSTLWPIGVGNRTIKASGAAKNNLVVGSIDDLASGFVNGASVVASAFSSRGPTDDGRIKPDLVANGTTVTSTNYSLGTLTAPANFSFETPAVTLGTDVQNVTSWTSDPSNSTSVRTARIANFAANQFQVARINASGVRIFIDVPAIALAANQVNVFTVGIGNLAGATVAGNQSRISVFTNGFATQLGTLTVDASTFTIDQLATGGTLPGRFAEISIPITIGATVPTGNVRFVLENAGAGPCFFDNVRWNNVPLNSYTDGATGTANAPVSGTSFSTPAVAGSANAVQVLNTLMGGEPLLSSTWRILFIHNADDADRLPAYYANLDGGVNRLYPGPDPFYGWGLANFRRSAEFLQAHLATNTRRNRIRQHALFTGSVIDIPVTVAAGTAELRVTEGHNDPAFQNVPIAASDEGLPIVGATDPPNPNGSMLMNDIDIRILRLDANGNVVQTFQPWRLDAANPRNAATQGDNTVDNVEQVLIANPVAGNYIIRISHKTTGSTYVAGSSSGNLRRLAKLLPGHPQYNAAIPRFEIISGGSQKVSLAVTGAVERPSDAFKATNISRATNATQSFSVVDWQSIKGLRYEAEKSTDLITWTKIINSEVGINTNPTATWLSATADDGSETVTIVQPVSNTRYFFRIREAGL